MFKLINTLKELPSNVISSIIGENNLVKTIQDHLDSIMNDLISNFGLSSVKNYLGLDNKMFIVLLIALIQILYNLVTYLFGGNKTEPEKEEVLMPGNVLDSSKHSNDFSDDCTIPSCSFSD